MSEVEKAPETPDTPDAAETEARGKGWVPKEEYKGKRDWKPAEEWLRDGDEISSLRRELAETKQAFVDFGRQNREAALKQAREELESKLDKAVEEGDKGEARKVAAEIKKVDKDLDSDEIPAPAKAFLEANKDWFGFHPRATDFARMRERRLLADGMSMDEVYKQVASDVADQFPEVKMNKQRDKAAAVDGGGTVRTRKKSGHNLHITDLPEQYQKIARDFVKRGVLTEEKYIQSLIDDGTLREV